MRPRAARVVCGARLVVRALPVLCVLAPPVSAAPAEGAIQVLESADDGSRDAALCRGFTLTPAEVRAYLARATPLSPREVHDHYDPLPCFVRGTLAAAAGPLDWRIFAGGLATMVLPDGSIVQLGDPTQRDLRRP